MADAAIDNHANPSKLMHTKPRKVDVTVVQPIRTIIARLWVPDLREQQLGTTVARLALVVRSMRHIPSSIVGVDIRPAPA